MGGQVVPAWHREAGHEYATYHGSSRSTITVNSLCVCPFCRPLNMLSHARPDHVKSSPSIAGGLCYSEASLLKESMREIDVFMFLETVKQDLRFGLRMLRRNPGFSILAILCLTLGIGANAAVFSWIEGILLRPFPAVAHQERLMAVAGTDRARGRSHQRMPPRLVLPMSHGPTSSIYRRAVGFSTRLLWTGSRGPRSASAAGPSSLMAALCRPTISKALGVRP